MRNWCYGILSLVLVGCASTEPVVEVPVYHPPWPAPVDVCPISPSLKIIDDIPYMTLTFDEYLVLGQCYKDYLRYVKEIKKVTCVYRPTKDAQCSKESNE